MVGRADLLGVRALLRVAHGLDLVRDQDLARVRAVVHRVLADCCRDRARFQRDSVPQADRRSVVADSVTKRPKKAR